MRSFRLRSSRRPGRADPAEPDFGTVGVVLMVAGVMVFAAGLTGAISASPRVAAGVPALCCCRWRRRTAPPVHRVFSTRGGPLGDGFQIIQSLIAIGSGGVTGRGLMQGVQKLFYLPEPHTDFIYWSSARNSASSARRWCCSLLRHRLARVRVSRLRSPDPFGAFLALGLTTMITVQALPTSASSSACSRQRASPLPFVSAGGSSLRHHPGRSGHAAEPVAARIPGVGGWRPDGARGPLRS